MFLAVAHNPTDVHLDATNSCLSHFFFHFVQLQALFMPYDHKNTTPNGASAHLMQSVLENLNHRHFQDSCLVGSGGGSVGYVHVTCFLFSYFYLYSFVVCYAVKFFDYITYSVKLY